MAHSPEHPESGTVQLGVHATMTDYSMPLLDLASEVEAHGFGSLWFAEHSHIPVGSDFNPRGGPMPRQYKHLLDPFIAGAYVAATTNLEIGTGVSLPAEHDAIALAKALATLDYLSHGRLIFGVGFGYNRPQAADHGFDAADRTKVAIEAIELMRAVWTQDVASYEGRFRSLSPSWSWPKPHRAGGPPILLGAKLTERNIARIVQWADGWIPMGPDILSESTLPDDVATLRRAWEAAGRDPAALQLVCFFLPTTPDVAARHIDVAAELGVQRITVFLEDRGRDEVMPILDQLAELRSAHLG